MNISFLIKAVSVWIELTLIFIHMANPEKEELSKCSFGESNCEFLCKARGYSYAVCNYDGCFCFRYYQSIGTSFRCQLSCERACQTLKSGETGICDRKSTCYCYMEHEMLYLEKDQCLVPEKYCRRMCSGRGFADAACADDHCICHNAENNVQLFNYRTGNCVLPRNYCHSRCVNATFNGGYCHHSDCVCTGVGDLYFVINLEDIETMCEMCRHFCERRWVAKGSCVNGDCICVNGDWYTVAMSGSPQQPIWGFTKDFCMMICAKKDFHTHAYATGYSSCRCSENNKTVSVKMQDTKVKPVWKTKKAYM